MSIMVLNPFNGVFFLLLAFFAIIYEVLYVIVKKFGKKIGENILCIIMFASLILFFVYKILLVNDLEYQNLRVSSGLAPTTIWNELPFALCNINMFIIPLGIITHRKSLLSFSFFIAPLGAFLAIAMPTVGFYDCSLFLPRMVGFYVTHINIIFCGICVFLFGLYKPAFKDIPITCVAIVSIAFIVFLINLVLIHTGINPYANYFFEFYSEGNPILEMFYNAIGIPFVYVLPLILVFAAYMCLITALCNIKKLFTQKQNPKTFEKI